MVRVNACTVMKPLHIYDLHFILSLNFFITQTPSAGQVGVGTSGDAFALAAADAANHVAAHLRVPAHLHHASHLSPLELLSAAAMCV